MRGGRKHPRIKAGDVSASGRWKATGDEFFDKEKGKSVVPCVSTVDPVVTMLVQAYNFRCVPKTARRRGKPVKAGDVSGNGRWVATGPQRRVGNSTVVPCVNLVNPGVAKLVSVGTFRYAPPTDMRWGKPLAIGDEHGGWGVTGYGDTSAIGVKLYAGKCNGCGCESRSLQASKLRKGVRHSCWVLRDRAGYTAHGYMVVRKQWHNDSVYWEVRNTASGVEELWTPARVEVELVGDLATLDQECGKAIRDAAFRGLDSPMLREIGTTVEAVQFYLPMNHYTKGDQLGHVFPRKLCLTPRTRVASWHPRLLRWIDKRTNVQMGSLAWLSQYADPVVVAGSQELLAMCLEDLHLLYPEGYWGHKHGRGRITEGRRALFGLPTREDEVSAWEREETAIRVMYEGYADPATLDGSEVYGGYDLTSESP